MKLNFIIGSSLFLYEFLRFLKFIPAQTKREMTVQRRTPIATLPLSRFLEDRCDVRLPAHLPPEIRNLRVILPEVCHSVGEAVRERYAADLVWSKSHKSLYSLRSLTSFSLHPRLNNMIKRCFETLSLQVRPAQSIVPRQQKKGGRQKTSQHPQHPSQHSSPHPSQHPFSQRQKQHQSLPSFPQQQKKHQSLPSFPQQQRQQEQQKKQLQRTQK